jgi:hypothetical protein
MQRRAVRRFLAALLVVTTVAAAYLTWSSFVRLRDGLGAEREIDARLDRITAATAAVGASQQAYVAPGQQRGDALTRASVLIQQMYDDIAGLRVRARAAGAAEALLALGSSLDALVNLDDRAREHLRLEQELMAADLLYTEARQALEGMQKQIEGLRAAELRRADEDRQALLASQLRVLGGAAAVWFLILFALVPAPAMAKAAEPRAAGSIVAREQPDTVAAPPPLDLNAAARVCGELARLSGEQSLAPVLARAARVLDASGLVVWLGAGEELFPAIGHGYGPRTLARLGPIGRSADNATAQAWRTGELTIVPGIGDANGAVVAPLANATGCFGVLAAELRHGREHDGDTQAAALMIAAQLSTVVAPGPAPSEIDESALTDSAEGTPAGNEHAASA